VWSNLSVKPTRYGKAPDLRGQVTSTSGNAMALIELLASLARVFQREELNHDQEQFSLHSGPAATRCRRPVSLS